MKIQYLRRKVITNFIASISLILIAVAIFIYTSSKRSVSVKEISNLRLETDLIHNQAQDLEGQSKDARKYKEVWKALDENKKNPQNIKMEEINNSLSNLAEKYSIYNQSLQVLLPETLESGIFQRKTLTMSHSNGTLSFDALSDVHGLYFITEFFNKLPGYAIITNLEINKTRKYTNEDLINISTGKNPDILRTKITFSWYVYHEKSSSNQ